MPHLLLPIPTSSYRTGDFLDATQRLGVHDIADQDITPRDLPGPTAALLKGVSAVQCA